MNNDEVIVNAIDERCTDVDSGSRNADNIMTNTLLPELLSRMAKGEQIKEVRVAYGDDRNVKGFVYQISK